MTTTLKTLGQSKPGANTDATLYTVPAATSTVVSTISIAETNGVAATYRITIDPAGGTASSSSKCLAWNVSIGANAVDTYTIGATLATGTTIVIRASTADVCFSAWGQENS